MFLIYIPESHGVNTYSRHSTCFPHCLMAKELTELVTWSRVLRKTAENGNEFTQPDSSVVHSRSPSEDKQSTPPGNIPLRVAYNLIFNFKKRHMKSSCPPCFSLQFFVSYAVRVESKRLVRSHCFLSEASA